MKTLSISIFALLSSLFTFANSHIIVKKNGEKMEVNYVASKDNVIYYTVTGSSQQHEISTYAVNKLIEKSTSKELISNDKAVESKSVTLIQANQTQGLTSGQEFKAAIKVAKGHSESSWTKSTFERLKKRAAAEGYSYLVVTEQTKNEIKVVGYKI